MRDAVWLVTDTSDPQNVETTVYRTREAAHRSIALMTDHQRPDEYRQVQFDGSNHKEVAEESLAYWSPSTTLTEFTYE